MFLGKAKTQSNIAWHRPMSTTFRLEEELMERSSRALDTTTDPVERLRLLCLSKGAAGIMELGRIFRRMGALGDKKLNKDDFIYAIKETGLEIDKKHIDELFNSFYADHSGSINLDEFLRQIRPPMSDYRSGIVEKVFKKLDKADEGAITVDEIRAVYAVTSQPSYMCGEETADLVMDRFLATFEADESDDGMVTLEDFLNYYSGLSVSIDNDCFFDLMMRQAYKL